MRYYGFLTLALMALVILPACTSLSTFQTARTLPKKTGRVVIGTGYLLGSKTHRPTGVSSLDTSVGELPLADIAFRTGVQKHFDLGAKLCFPSTLSLDGKYQFLDHSLYALATGIGLSYVVISSELIEENKGVRYHYLDFFLPIYLSVDFNKNLGLYSSLQFILRKNAYSGVAPSKLIVSSLGFRLGNKKGVFFEGNYAYDLDRGANATQLNIGFFFGSAPSIPGADEIKEIPPEPENTSSTEGHVIRFFPKTKSITFTHPNYGVWRVTDRICVIQQKIKIACGTITKITPHHARAKLNYTKKHPPHGTLVILDK